MADYRDVLEVQFDGKTFADLEGAMDDFGKDAIRAMAEANFKLKLDATETLRRVHRRLAEAHGTPWSPSGGGGKFLFKRSGQGLDDILASITSKGNRDGVEASIAARGYMAIHETGGTITPKRSKYLTIPLPAALDKRGMPIHSSARDWPNTFVQRSKRGNLLIFQKRGTQIVPLYVLKSSVFLPARLGMAEAVHSELGYFEQKTLDRISWALESA